MSSQLGATFIELLIVIVIMSFLTFSSVMIVPTHFKKARDAQRKSDLANLKVAMEDYAGDRQCFPTAVEMSTCGGAALAPYMSNSPCDPTTDQPYYYIRSSDCLSYELYATLEVTSDPAIENVGCAEGCGPSNQYNYGVSGGTAPWQNK